MGIKDWFTTERQPDWQRMRENIKVGTGIVFLKNILSFLVKFVIGVVGVGVVIFLMVGILIFAVRTVSTGTGDVFMTKLGVSLDKIPAGNVLKVGFSSIFGAIWNPETVLEPSMKTDVDKNSDRNLGIVFTKFSAEPGKFVEDTDFSSYGWVEVTPFEKEDDLINIRFECELDNEECKEAEPKEMNGLYGYQTETFTVSCECNSGEAKKNVDGKVVGLKAYYDFITRGYLSVYVMGKAELDSVKKTGGDVFQGISNPKLDKNKGIVTSTYSNGPLKLGIGSYYSQPFTEGGPAGDDSYYIMKIELSRKLSAHGRPNKIKELNLFVPDFIEIDKSDEVFVDGDKRIDGFKSYKLSSDYVEELNHPCEKILFKLDDLTDPDCRKLWEKGFLPVYAYFRIINVGGGLTEGYVMVEAKYVYEESIYEDIVVMKTPEGGVNEE